MLLRSEMNVNFEWNADEHIPVVRSTLWHLERRRITLLVSVVLLIMAYSATMMVVKAARHQPVGPQPLFIGMCLVWLGVLYWRIPRKLVRLQGPSLEGMRTFTLGSSGIDMKSPGMAHHLEWAGVTLAVETEKLVIIRGGGGVVCIIPKRAIADADLPHLREVLIDQLGGKAKLMS